MPYPLVNEAGDGSDELAELFHFPMVLLLVGVHDLPHSGNPLHELRMGLVVPVEAIAVSQRVHEKVVDTGAGFGPLLVVGGGCGSKPGDRDSEFGGRDSELGARGSQFRG